MINRQHIAKLILGLSLTGLLWACDQKTADSTAAAQESSSPSAAVPASNTAAIDSAAISQAAQPAPAMAEFKFDKMDHDFGKIYQGDVVKHKFTFTNNGGAPLVISSVQPQCGCTATNYTKEAVPPGGKGEIELQFDSSGKEGQQNKMTTVFANVPGGSVALIFTAFVEAKSGIPLRKQ